MKKALALFLGILLTCVGGILFAFGNDSNPKPDVLAINDAVTMAMQTDDRNEAVNLLARQILHEQERMKTARERRDAGLFLFLLVHAGLLAAAGLWLYLYCERGVLSPFRKLQRFARDVAAGRLDIPLEMDRRGAFGAFTESFDLMREELKKARENERNAERSKKELVAAISHDVKTPVASIKAATEFMLVGAREEKDRRQLERIGEKAEQINALITDMFHTTLEELQELSVAVTEIPSDAIPRLIQNADYKGRVEPFAVPDCLVLADAVRLQQVFDNVLDNSYKYAGTDVVVRSAIEGGRLVVEVRDFGVGVPHDELPLIFGKFHRGENAGDKTGYGLGLYIAKNLLTHMGGDIHCDNRPDGFAVMLSLRLAGGGAPTEN